MQERFFTPICMLQRYPKALGFKGFGKTFGLLFEHMLWATTKGATPD